ncbi:hypothetical protein EMIHUDRAFT_223086 [Emiliania huxleyi CCMP1516]|uniref:Origin recognition complex subunit 4 C-terminal domain-containing protein n=2 Tax=Emiliania huxleyi TaxID=2903 RepID=A0A0D3KWR4_EMIH1|nr:hypothetical protein EMIHUDRAFT_206870 [Emiliania huxleyi CCMP1516]XP_005792628.1 hypothetical protein EMIHUDRAFT_223086 [Emiliania huxleyi CCMP1516]EOD23897.1 hypothetical protein EMIHUDRAFT_206870 [Emiliania huxleyi CCMP1516]EOD40199.1 hypothetical protein EMIHUDRAFT_223086 [Emiliania huxleyi CCMP1516]|eukprot:XP_005776326.1 hypothetical protein EMIHUDRAFT_206870 [Emiliania huxleyi CCMP1516]
MEVEEAELREAISEAASAAVRAPSAWSPGARPRSAVSGSAADAADAPPTASVPTAAPLRDEDGFPLEPEQVAPLLRAARRGAYARLLAPAAESGLLSHLHAAARDDLREILLRTAGGLENSTALLLGPRGAGKHRVLCETLAELRGKSGAAGADFLVVDVSAVLMTDEVSTLMGIAAQLNLTAQIHMRRFGSFADGLRHMLHLLRRSRPGSQGEGQREGQAQPVCFVLHNFEDFALRPKQTLLYSLFDLCQTDDAQMAVIGLTSRVDALDLLEKRVRSRFSGRQLALSYLPTVADATSLLRRALSEPVPAEAKSVDGRLVRPFHGAWASAVDELCAALEASPTLERLLWHGLTPRTLLAGLKLHLAALSPAAPLPTADGVEAALARELPLPVAEALLPELSVVELLLLLCLQRRLDTDAPPPHTLRAVLREYHQFLADAPEAAAHPALVLRLSPRALECYVRDAAVLPTHVRRFGVSWLK